jgi:hypothetical protein
LPAARDPEDYPVKIRMSDARQKPLPSFITFNPVTNEYSLAPTKKTKLAIYII